MAGNPATLIYGKLANTAPATTILGSTKIYPMVIPQGVALPAITYSQISDPREHAMVGDPNIMHPRYQVSSWSTSYSQVKSLAYQVRLALQDLQTSTGTNIHRVFFENEIEMSEVDPMSKEITFHIAQDYIIWWSS